MRAGILLACAASACPGPWATAQTVEFNRDIRPVLSDRCFTCHGPDAAARKIKLRLDSEAAARADLGGRSAIVPGDTARSELVRRITSTNQALRMPPPYSGLTLSPSEIELLQRWVQQGATWQKHWSLIAPRRPPAPAVLRSAWVRNGIDPFVLARLEKEGLSPSAEAPKETLIRRVSLDLTGLPPTTDEVDAFLADSSPDAYEKVVDRLLASPRYGERMAIRWLEASRYADTNGYQTDAERFMWRWRDWVIEAFNRNQPFDRFIVEQMAGDLLPNATLEQKIATGFHRNHRGNGEGGIIPEEYLVEYAADRVETMATVFLGITLGCARCHNHKYDPFTQREYYQLFAYFNNIPEKGRVFKYGNSPPLVQAPTPDQQRKLLELEQRLAAAADRLRRLEPAIAEAEGQWRRNGPAPAWWQTRDLVVRHGSLERFDGKRLVDLGDRAHFGFHDRFTLAARVYLDAGGGGAVITRGVDEAEASGYSLVIAGGKVQLNLVQRWLDDALRVETERALEPGRWHHIAASYDGSLVADGVRIFIDGESQPLKVLLDELNQDFRTGEPLRIGGGAGPGGRFRGSIEDARVYSAVLTPDEVAVAALPQTTPSLQERALRNYSRWSFLEQHAAPELRAAWAEWRQAERSHAHYAASLPTVMVMQENPQPKDTFLLVRGAYDKPGDKVQRAVPAALPNLPEGAPNNRLGLALWLVDPSNPLTARVLVNRFWQAYFGTGLVKTVEDFGSQGEWPSHPDLLDWLAVEFVDSGWNTKHLQKTIVMSATYRQSSVVSPALLQRDPDNRLLARGPRLRLPAEMVRDQALLVSGLLVEKLGGPSVKPYQPAGLWKELSGGSDYQRDSGENLYRRSLYTFWKRAAPPPFLMNFDAAGRETCVVREARTNTPLQALNLMNDVTFVEAARVLAERMIREGGSTPSDRLAWAFRRATARYPNPKEQSILSTSLHHFLDHFRTRPQAAGALLSQGERKADASLDPAETAAYASVASLILNLDEVITKE